MTRDTEQKNLQNENVYLPGPDGIFASQTPAAHRAEEYDPRGFDILSKMQIRHFWYRGRHRFLLHAVKCALGQSSLFRSSCSLVDLGGGCGGWVKYLVSHKPVVVSEIALADSSHLALERAGTLLPAEVARYQVDLMDLQWNERWDGAFLLDVLEHLPDDGAAMRQVAASLRPGGLVFVTMPALRCFWSFNDEIAQHRRRYNRQDLVKLAEVSGLRLLSSCYFMFLLSPIYWLSRFKPGISKLTLEQKRKLAVNCNSVPPLLLNEALAAVFCAETPLGHWIQFPWGTSIFGLFQKPEVP